MPPSRSRKIQKTPVRPSSQIRPTRVEDQLISFSFKYLKRSGKFEYRDRECNYYCKLLERLKDFCGKKRLEFTSDRSGAVRTHQLVWAETTEDSFGLPQEEDLVDTPYQFSISGNEHGRVHGFFIDTVFHVVWLDPDHNLYPLKM